MKPNLTRAIYSLVGNTTPFYCDSNQIIEWDVGDEKTNITQPTASEIQTELQRLQVEYDAKAYQRSREEAYPSIADQLDDLYHNGIDEWKKTIKIIKDKYPK